MNIVKINLSDNRSEDIFKKLLYDRFSTNFCFHLQLIENGFKIAYPYVLNSIK